MELLKIGIIGKWNQWKMKFERLENEIERCYMKIGKWNEKH